MRREEADQSIDHSAQAQEKWRQLNTEKLKQDKSKLDNAVYSLLLQNQPGLAKRHLWFFGGLSTSSWLHFPDGPGASLWGSYDMVIATLVEPALTNMYVCTFVNRPELRVRAFISFYTTFPKKLHDPRRGKKKKHYFHGWQPNTLTPKERAMCACTNGLLSKGPLWFVRLTPGEWDKEEFHPQAIPQVSSWPLLQTRFPEEGENKLLYICRVWPSSYSQALSCLITLPLKGQALAKEYPALSYPSS